MALPTGLTKRPKSGIYWIRLRVPVDLHAAVGRKAFTETLGTTDKALALVLFRDRIVDASVFDRYRRRVYASEFSGLASRRGQIRAR